MSPPADNAINEGSGVSEESENVLLSPVTRPGVLEATDGRCINHQPLDFFDAENEENVSPTNNVKFLPLELGSDFLPISYRVHLTFPVIKRHPLDFYGFCQIKFVPQRLGTLALRLHVDLEYIDLESISVFEKHSQRGFFCVLEHYEARDMSIQYGKGVEGHVVKIVLKEAIYPKENIDYFLNISYFGQSCEESQGLYVFPCSKDTKEGDTDDEVCISTALEPLYARRVFPCLDSPNYRASIILSVTFPLKEIPANDEFQSPYTCEIKRSVSEVNTNPHLVPISCGNAVLAFDDFVTPSFCCDVLHLKRVGITRFDTKHPIRGSHAFKNLSQHECGKKWWYRTVEFGATPPLPMFAAGLFIGPFKGIHGQSIAADNHIIRVSCWTLCPNQRQSVEDYLAFSLKCALDSVGFFEQTFGGVFENKNTSFAMDKLDLIGLPVHRGLGLENYGCISFLESYFVCDEKKTPWLHLFRIRRLIAHEISHMWLGDAITPQSFDELWLKEGLARYVEFAAINDEEFHLNAWAYFMFDVFLENLYYDVMDWYIHPVHVKGLMETKKVVQSFNHITYGGGACLIRMLAGLAGTETILDGLRNLCIHHMYSSVTNEDLWRCIVKSIEENRQKSWEDDPPEWSIPFYEEKASGWNLEEIMKFWLITPGFPKISVSLLPPEKDENNKNWVLKVTQEQASSGKAQYEWPIPLLAVVGGKKIQGLLCTETVRIMCGNSFDQTVVIKVEDENGEREIEVPTLFMSPESSGYYAHEIGDYLSWQITIQTIRDGWAPPLASLGSLINLIGDYWRVSKHNHIPHFFEQFLSCVREFLKAITAREDKDLPTNRLSRQMALEILTSMCNTKKDGKLKV
eukprot:GHVP01022912.1.p1 GENE.GHVP01022912.1~~GHVP01022912.1.p1  ORF type:complete len:857 (+),score=126.74 GHVP01022912.1:1406-3976(+)